MTAMMKSSVALGTVALAAVGAGAAAADGAWQGAYVGVSSATNSGVANWDCDCYDFTGSNTSGFLGYNFQSGNMVFGAEVGYGLDPAVAIDEAPYYLNNMLDLKARVGMTFGSVLAYGFAGTSSGMMDGQYDSSPFAGTNYGAGVEYQVNDGLVLGLEYMARTISSEDGYLDARPMSSVALRASFNF